MKVHHLNCGTMRSLPGLSLVCHVLLVETDRGMVLVDTGFGILDCADPATRIGLSRHVIRPALDPAETAARQIEAMGFSTDDVRHIVVTHFDMDHIGGIADFPHARIHVTADEAYGAMRHPSPAERLRYRRVQWSHGPHIVEHRPVGERWRGFPAAAALEEIDPGIVLIPLAGHSRGHAGVAVDAGNRWILHAGDAFYHRGVVDGRNPVPRALRLQDRLNVFDRKQLQENHARLAELYARAEPDLLIVCAHDPEMLARARETD
jgi:glyoxylase-like metal-dependent hydrolase (beta-lactamase superfamily II)